MQIPETQEPEKSRSRWERREDAGAGGRMRGSGLRDDDYDDDVDQKDEHRVLDITGFFAE